MKTRLHGGHGIDVVPTTHQTQRIIVAGFLLVLVLMSLLTALGLKHMATIKARMINLITESNVKTESVYQMRSLSRERFASLVQIVVIEDYFDRDEEVMRFNAQAAPFIQARDRLLGMGMNPEERSTWERARELIRQDEILHARVIQLALSDQGNTAMGVLLREVRPLENSLLAIFDEMVEQHRHANQDSLRESEAEYRDAVLYMLGLAILATAMGLMITWHVVLRSRQAEKQLSQQTQSVLKAAEQLSWAASHDSLTGLANRREMERRLVELIQDTKAHGIQHVLLYIDLDRFKDVNDNCGHHVGDELLQQAAQIFNRHVRRGDAVGRLGGDEFCICLVSCEYEKACQIAEAIRHELEQYSLPCEGGRIQTSASIGLVQIDPEMDIDHALKAADTACYLAKERGRNQVIRI